MNFSTNVCLKLLLLSVISVSMVACGSNQADSYNLSSRVVDSNTGSKSVAICNEGSSSSTALKLKASTNSAGTAYRMDQVFMKLTTVPSGFTAGTDYFNFWRWMASSSNSTYIDPTPLSFYLYDTQTNQAVTGVRNSLKWSDVSGTASTWGVDAAGFFQRVILVIDVRDANGEFDVIKTARYNLSSNALAESIDTLLPLFYANPSDYAYESNGTTRASSLTALHPFKSMIGQGWSTSQFVSASNSYCF